MIFLKHLFTITGALPFLPYMFFQGYNIRKKTPKLLPPTDMTGTIGKGHPPFRLLTVGESTIAGIGVKTHREGITGYLSAFLSEHLQREVRWEVFAKSGLTSKGILEKLQSEPIQHPPDLIVIGTGANDGFRLKSPLVFREYISQVIIFLQNKFPETPIVFANMPPIRSFPAFPPLVKLFVGKTVDRYGQTLEKLIAAFPGVYFDQKKIRELNWGLEGSSVNDFFSDGVHPSKLAYRLWAERIGDFILEQKLL